MNRRACRPGRVGAATATAVAVLTTIAGCAAVERPAGTVRDVAASRPPPVNGEVDYQIGGAYPAADEVDVVVRDRTELPVPGRYGICYLNAFQTQPDETSEWLTQRGELLLRSGNALVEDPGWPGEILLDISTPAHRSTVVAIVGAWIDGCADAGYDAVELDNFDSWTRSGGALTADDAVATATLLVDRAHARGLTAAQKNSPELAAAGSRQVGFDFAVVEGCQEERECGALLRAYGSAVIEVEYVEQAFREACVSRGDRISVVLRDRDVVPPGQPGYRRDAC